MRLCDKGHNYTPGKGCPTCNAARLKLRRENAAKLKARYDAQNRKRQEEKDRLVRDAVRALEIQKREDQKRKWAEISIRMKQEYQDRKNRTPTT